MEDQNGKTLEEGCLSTLTVVIKSVGEDTVTVDLGDGHYATLNAAQVRDALLTEGVKAPDKPVKEPETIDGESMTVEVSDSSTSSDGAN